MPTNVRSLVGLQDDLNALIEEKENPEEWCALVGSFAGEYSVHAAEMPEELTDANDDLPPEAHDATENVDGFFQIGSSGCAADAFADNCGFVGEYGGNSEELDTSFLHTLIVHESLVSEAVIEHTDTSDQTYPFVPSHLEDHTAPVEAAEGYIHVGEDTAYNPLGGYWLPAAGLDALVDTPPEGALVRYPDDDRPPELRGSDDLPDWAETWDDNANDGGDD